MCKYPFFDPNTQPIFDYLELMKSHFMVNDVLQEERQVGIILSYIPSEYYDSLVALSAPLPVCALRLADLELKLKFLMRPPASVVVNMRSFYERKKLSTESYSYYYTDFDKLAERCSLENKVDSIKF